MIPLDGQGDVQGPSQLKAGVLALGAWARRAVVDAVAALDRGDPELAQEVVAGQAHAAQQGRLLDAGYRQWLLSAGGGSALRVALLDLMVEIELAGIGRHGANIARVVLAEPRSQGSLGRRTQVRRLSELSVGLVDQALTAFRCADPAQARDACVLAESIDALYVKTFDVVPGYHLDDPRLAAGLLNLTRIVQELERVGDRALVIAERVIQTYEQA